MWGELRTGEIHVLVYNSSTDTWTSRLCSDEVDKGIFRSHTFSAVDGNTIYVLSLFRYHSLLASYNLDTGLFFEQRKTWPPHRWFDNKLIDRVETLGIIAYKSRIHLLILIFCHDNRGNPFALVGVWKSNPDGTLWDLLTTEGLPFPSM